MSQMTITGVPRARVPAVEAGFRREGAIDVKRKDKGDGTFDVTTIFPEQRSYQDLVAAKKAAKAAT